jgi:hypothetical protein
VRHKEYLSFTIASFSGKDALFLFSRKKILQFYLELCWKIYIYSILIDETNYEYIIIEHLKGK